MTEPARRPHKSYEQDALDVERQLQTLCAAIAQAGPDGLHQPALQLVLILLSHWAKRLAANLLADLKAPSPQHSAEDAAQDLMVKLPVLALKIRPGAPILPFLYGTLRNICRHIARRNRREQGFSPDFALAASADNPRDCFFREQDKEALQIALQKLSPPERETVTGRYWGGESSAEIARRRGESTAAIDTRLHRGRNKLRAALAEYEQDANHPCRCPTRPKNVAAD